MEINDNVGNEQPSQGDNQTQGTEQRVNAGAIRKAQTAGILNALSAASGQQFDSVEAAVAFMARTSSQNIAGNEQPQQVQNSQKRMTTNDLADQFQSLRQELAQKEQALREKELDSEIRSVMGDRFDSDLIDYAMSKVKSNIKWNDDGSYAIVNAKGQERYTQEGVPMTIAGVVEEVAKSNTKLLRQNTLPSGSGLRPGQGNFAGAPADFVPDYSRDPAAFNAWAHANGLGKSVGLKGVGVNVSNSYGSKKII